MTRQHLRFYELEHDGDLDVLYADLIDCGAQIVHARINMAAGTGEIVFEMADVMAFRRAFRATPSAHWLDIGSR
jgi:hypothetical protein